MREANASLFFCHRKGVRQVPDVEREFIKTSIEDYLDIQEIEVTDEQFKRIYNGVQNWLNENMEEAISESVANVLY